MKWISIIFVLLIFRPGYASECGAFVGHWEGQCHADDKDGLGSDFDYDIEISKLSDCQGFHFLGQDLFFNKVTFNESTKANETRLKHGSLKWVDSNAKDAVEIFSSVIKTIYSEDTKEIVKMNSYKNNFVLRRMPEGKLSIVVQTQMDFQRGDRYVCSLGLRR